MHTLTHAHTHAHIHAYEYIPHVQVCCGRSRNSLLIIRLAQLHCFTVGSDCSRVIIIICSICKFIEIIRTEKLEKQQF